MELRTNALATGVSGVAAAMLAPTVSPFDYDVGGNAVLAGVSVLVALCGTVRDDAISSP